MRKWTKVDDYHIKSGMWTINKPKTPEMYPTPYGLYLGKQHIGHFKTAVEAKEHADFLEVTQA